MELSKTAPSQDYYGYGQGLTKSENVERPRDRHMRGRTRDDHGVDITLPSQSNRRNDPDDSDSSPETQARQELQVFRRVHLQSSEGFLESYVGNDKSHFEDFDKQHVREKFPEAEEWLLSRLGRCITKRRRILAAFSEAEKFRIINRLASDVHKPAQDQQFEAAHARRTRPQPESKAHPVHSAEFLEPDWFRARGLPPPHIRFGNTATSYTCSICFRQQQHLADNEAWKYAIDSVDISQI